MYRIDRAFNFVALWLFERQCELIVDYEYPSQTYMFLNIWAQDSGTILDRVGTFETGVLVGRSGL